MFIIHHCLKCLDYIFDHRDKCPELSKHEITISLLSLKSMNGKLNDKFNRILRGQKIRRG